MNRNIKTFIEQVNEPSPWISPMVPIPKGDDVRSI